MLAFPLIHPSSRVFGLMSGLGMLEHDPIACCDCQLCLVSQVLLACLKLIA